MHSQLPLGLGAGAGPGPSSQLMTGPPLQRRVAAFAAAPSQRQQPAPAAQQPAVPAAAGSKPKPKGDWSSRLMAVAKEHKDKKAGADQVDVFTPGSAKNQRKFQSEYDFTDEDADAELSDPSVYEQEGAFEPDQKRIPAEMRFFDTARISIKSGDGGSGCVAFRREKFVEFGGPAGGTGGRGGNVWAIVTEDLNSLTCFRHKLHWRADNGRNGEGSNCDGADAGDLYVPVPSGTIIRRKDAEEGDPPLAELLHVGDKALLAVGGRGGRGNYSFKTSRNKAPTIAEKGEKGAEMWVDLELKVVADVGIVGIPNAGKSTLLSVLTAAKPKIANYPFTTLVPNLGVCELDYKTTVFADVPGLLEGAHEGLGLGHEFLRHVQRCRVLVHVLDGTSPDAVGDYRAINLELELFNPELKDKPQIVAYNKVDLPDSGDFWEFAQETLTQQFGLPADRLFPISAATGQGVTELVRAVRAMLDAMGPQELAYETNALNQAKLPKRTNIPIDAFSVTLEEDEAGVRTYIVEGEGIERFAQMTNWDYYEAVRRFQRVLDVTGINAALRQKGAKEGDTVVIGEAEFFYQNDQKQKNMYQGWLDDMKARGVNLQGLAHWPKPDLSRDRD